LSFFRLSTEWPPTRVGCHDQTLLYGRDELKQGVAPMADSKKRGRVRVEPGQKRIRATLAGKIVAESDNTLLVWEKPYYPTYYFPSADVDTSLLTPSGETNRSPSRGESALHNIKVGGAERPNAAAWYRESPIEELVDHIRFDWPSLDGWYEEEEEVYVHARDPYARIDILPSSRHIRVEIDGVTVADTSQPRLLFETGLPVRYYIPKGDVKMELLTSSDLITSCPYKGDARYYNVTVNGTVHPDLVWWYPFPVEESNRIAGYVSFYNEKVDIYVDGELEAKPDTVFA
jgi:uncharacterized protein (DUF427 family)